MRKSLATSIGLTLMLAIVVLGSVAGCSGDSTAVVEGDGEARRKSKDAALEKMLYPNGKPAASAKNARGRAR